MKLRIGCVVVGLLSLILSLVQLTVAQTPAQTVSALPHLVRFGGTVKDLNGNPLTGVVGITFALYSEQTDGASLWLETQNVTADSAGRYTVLLGSTTSQGLPESIFTSEQARWVGVQVSGQAEQPRVLLVSAPYALKAGDAETIGGLPPSAFVLAAPAGANGGGPGSPPPPPNAGPTIGGSGTQNYIPIWTDSSGDLGNSILFQSGTTEVGIGTTTPAATLDVNGSVISRGALQLPSTGTATATKGFNSQPFSLQGSSFNGTKAIGPLFQWQTEPSGNNTSGAAGTLNLLYGNGSGSPAETGLNIASTGLITFPTGQTFPGTITTVTAGTGLSETGSGGKITLSINVPFANEFYAQLAAANTFTKSQTVNGTMTATTFSGSGSALTNVNASQLGGLSSSAFAQLGASSNTFTGGVAAASFTGSGAGLTNVTAGNSAELGGLPPSAYQPAGSYATTGSNTFTGNQNITGNLAATGSVSGAAATFTGLVTEAGALLPAIGTATASQAFNSQPFDSVTSVFNSTGGAAQNQDFRWLAEPVGNNTSSPSGKLDLLFGANGTTPTETGLSVASNGQITFATGQTFPGGGGTVTSVGSGLGLKGGPITTSGTLSIDTTVIPQLGAANTFAANQTVNGTINATSSGLPDTIVGINTSTGTFAAGVQGAATAATGATIGVYGDTESSGGMGVSGEAFSLTGLTYGVFGQAQSPTGYGVEGFNGAQTGNSVGVYGTTMSNVGYGVWGVTTGSLGTGVEGDSPFTGVRGTSAGFGVLGIGNGTAGVTEGVAGTTPVPTGYGVVGSNNSSSGTTAGVLGQTQSPAGYGVQGTSPGTGVYGTSTGSGYGVEGLAGGNGGTAGFFQVLNSSATILQGNNNSTAEFKVDSAGDVIAAGAVSGSSFQIAGQPFAFGNYAHSNAFLGFAGSLTTNSTVELDTAVGNYALFQDTGGLNTAVGASTLEYNTTGTGNIGIGFFAGGTNDQSNLTGGGNTALGYDSGFSTGTLNNATAIGANAYVSESNALILGNLVNVGIGTSAPTAALDVVGNNMQALIGDAGCGSGFAGIGFVNKGGFNNCENYAFLGDVPGNVYINSSLSGNILFRNNNGNNTGANLMTIDASGNVNIHGNLSKGGGSFKIDHPLDPANKYLYHSFVESPDMMNVYNGNITTNKAGLATVVLPDYFEALNRDFRYQLTVIGQFAQAIVAKEVSKGRFTIKTNRPGVKVSWQVTGIRQDAYANAHRIPTEVEKPLQEQGHYLHPELFGAGPEQAVGYDGSQYPATAPVEPTPTGGSRP